MPPKTVDSFAVSRECRVYFTKNYTELAKLTMPLREPGTVDWIADIGSLYDAWQEERSTCAKYDVDAYVPDDEDMGVFLGKDGKNSHCQDGNECAVKDGSKKLDGKGRCEAPGDLFKSTGQIYMAATRYAGQAFEKVLDTVPLVGQFVRRPKRVQDIKCTSNPAFRDAFQNAVINGQHPQLTELPIRSILLDEVEYRESHAQAYFYYDQVTMRAVFFTLTWLFQTSLIGYWDMVLSVSMFYLFGQFYRGKYILAFAMLRIPREQKFKIFSLLYETVTSNPQTFLHQEPSVVRAVRAASASLDKGSVGRLVSLYALALCFGIVRSKAIRSNKYMDAIVAAFNYNHGSEDPSSIIDISSTDPFNIDNPRQPQLIDAAYMLLVQPNYVNACMHGYGLSESIWMHDPFHHPSMNLAYVNFMDRGAGLKPQPVPLPTFSTPLLAILYGKSYTYTQRPDMFNQVSASTGAQLLKIMDDLNDTNLQSLLKHAKSSEMMKTEKALLEKRLIACRCMWLSGLRTETWDPADPTQLPVVMPKIHDILLQDYRKDTKLKTQKDWWNPVPVSDAEFESAKITFDAILKQRIRWAPFRGDHGEHAVIQALTELLAAAQIVMLYGTANPMILFNATPNASVSEIACGTDIVADAYNTARKTLLEYLLKDVAADTDNIKIVYGNEVRMRIINSVKGLHNAPASQLLLVSFYLLASYEASTEASPWLLLRKDQKNADSGIWKLILDLATTVMDICFSDATSFFIPGGAKYVPPGEYVKNSVEEKTKKATELENERRERCIRLRDEGYVDPRSDCTDDTIKRIRLAEFHKANSDSSLETKSEKQLRVLNPTGTLPPGLVCYPNHPRIIYVNDITEISKVFVSTGLSHGYMLYGRIRPPPEAYMVDVDFQTADPTQLGTELLCMRLITQTAQKYKRLTAVLQRLLPQACFFVYVKQTRSAYKFFKRLEFGNAEGIGGLKESQVHHYKIFFNGLLAILWVHASRVAHTRIHPGVLKSLADGGSYFLGGFSHALPYYYFKAKTTSADRIGFNDKDHADLMLFAHPAPRTENWTHLSLLANDVWGMITSILSLTGNELYVVVLRAYFANDSRLILPKGILRADQLKKVSEVQTVIRQLFNQINEAQKVFELTPEDKKKLAVIQEVPIEKLERIGLRIDKDAFAIICVALTLAWTESELLPRLRIIMDQIIPSVSNIFRVAQKLIVTRPEAVDPALMTSQWINYGDRSPQHIDEYSVKAANCYLDQTYCNESLSLNEEIRHKKAEEEKAAAKAKAAAGL